jgi:predicted ATPase/class 3 adenylate cyclase
VPRNCPTCGTENPDAARFCFSCGTALEEGAPTPRKERKFATALFADLVGSTALAEREDPEVVQSVVSRAFDRLAREIERYGGLLEKFMGDALLAVFGVPTAHEDDPERAVRAALEMQAVLSELDRGFAAEGKPELAMRIGIEAGEVLVDLDRVSGTRDRMLTGDAVNTAARLQSAAEPGAVVVGPGVYEATKEVIGYEELVPLMLKGKAEPVPAWEARRIMARRRGERAALGLEARLIGRDEELSVLQQTFQRVESEGRPALVTVLGPAGVGKSRLSLELFRYLEGLPGRTYWRKGRCLGYGNVSYSALAEAVKAQCEILEDDPPDVASDKANRAVTQLFGDDSVAAEIRTLVGAGAERAASREELFDAWRRFLERMAARYPLVLVLEDIHWADTGLLDFIDHLADWGQGPILVLAMARPELLDIRPNWGGGKRNYSAIYLDPLSPEENAALVDGLLSSALPEELKRLVVERSEGNPLYTEEIVRMFIDRGFLSRSDDGRWALVGQVSDVDVPRSIQGLIAARLDSLPREEKAVLQDAAVIGRTFWLGATQRLAGTAASQVRDALGRLRVKEIVVPREPPTFSGEMEFAFRHVLIRDVAYDTLPKSLRADKHAEVAAWAEDRAGERKEEIAELLATHYREAVRYLEEMGVSGAKREALERAVYRWSRAAGDRAMRLWQKPEAIRWYRTALEMAERIESLAEIDIASLWEGYGDASRDVESVDEETRAYLAALERYERIGRPLDIGRLEATLAMTGFRAGRDQDVLPRLEAARSRLEQLGDTRELALTLSILGRYLWRRGRLDEAIEPLGRAEEMAARVGDRVLEAEAMLTRGVLYDNLNQTAKAIELAERSFEIAKETADLELLLRCYNNFPALINWILGDTPRAVEILTEGLELAQKSGNVGYIGWIGGGLAWSVAELGRYSDAEAIGAAAIDAARAVGDSARVGMDLWVLATATLVQGRPDEAEGYLDEAEQIVEANPEPQAAIVIPQVRAQIALARGNIEDTVEILQTGASQFSDDELRWGGARLMLELIRALAKVGRREDALRYAPLIHAAGVSRRPTFALARWADGFIAEDPIHAEEALREASELFEHSPLNRARCLIDLAEVERGLGKDPRPHLEEATEILRTCNARLYLREAEAALASL